MSCLFKDIAVLLEDGRILEHACVGVKDKRISYVGATLPPEEEWEQTVEGGGMLLMPGLYNSHGHVPMTLLRGYGEDMPLDRWLNDRIFPFEDKLTGEDVYWGSLLGIAEMLASGTVSFTDMYYFCDDIVRAVEESGIKANIGRGTSCFDPAKKYADLPAYKELLSLLDTVHGRDDGRILVDVAPHSEYTTRPDILRDMAAVAKSYRVRMQVHLSETYKEQMECVGRHGLTPTQVMLETGVLEQPVTLAHCVWLTDPDMELIASAPDAVVAHCMKSNLKLGSGIARIANMREKGIPVAIGTDSVASNNGLDMLEEMRVAALVAKGISRNPEAMPANEVLRMGTCVGALSQGRNDCGVIAVGQRADLVALRLDTTAMIPSHDLLANIVYAANGSTVALTMVDGRILYRDGAFLTLDVERVRYEVKRRAREIPAR